MFNQFYQKSDCSIKKKGIYEHSCKTVIDSLINRLSDRGSSQ